MMCKLADRPSMRALSAPVNSQKTAQIRLEIVAKFRTRVAALLDNQGGVVEAGDGGADAVGVGVTGNRAVDLVVNVGVAVDGQRIRSSLNEEYPTARSSAHWLVS